MSARVIFHIDLNSFFASAEVLKNSALQGQPVIVAGLNRRSVVSTASYEARKFGVHSAMPLHMALEKCPDLVIVQGDYSWYVELSERFFRFIKTFTPLVEPASIDECYVDVTDIIAGYKRPLDLAWIMQQRIMEELQLPCSIGVAPNKFLAKMASDMRKPMGITVLRKHEVPKKLWTLPINDMWGIGTKTAKRLIDEGMTTIKDLADVNNELKIMTMLGKHAYNVIQNARGNDTNQLSYNHSVQSISQSTTMDHDISEYDEVKAVFVRLAASLSKRAKQDNIRGSLISISIRYSDFSNALRCHTIDFFTNDEAVLMEQALLLFDKHNNGNPIRHLGIGLGSLYSSTKSITQLNIFQQKPQVEDIHSVLDELNKQVIGKKLTTASDILKKKE